MMMLPLRTVVSSQGSGRKGAVDWTGLGWAYQSGISRLALSGWVDYDHTSNRSFWLGLRSVISWLKPWVWVGIDTEVRSVRGSVKNLVCE